MDHLHKHPSAEIELQAGSCILNDRQNNASGLFYVQEGEIELDSHRTALPGQILGEALWMDPSGPTESYKARKKSRLLWISHSQMAQKIRLLPAWLQFVFRKIILQAKSPPSVPPRDPIQSLAFFLQRQATHGSMEMEETLAQFCWLTGIPLETAQKTVQIFIHNHWIQLHRQEEPFTISRVHPLYLQIVVQYRTQQFLNHPFAPFELPPCSQGIIQRFPSESYKESASESYWLSFLQSLDSEFTVQQLIHFKDLGLWRPTGDGILTPHAPTLEWFRCALDMEPQLKALPQ